MSRPREESVRAPDVAFVMPVFRPRAEWLRAAVASVLEQQECALELVVVDDGNDEPVAALLAGVADPRLRHLRVPHRGVSAARNAGVAAARGAYLRFVDADDVLERGSTARLLALATPTTIAYEDTVVCDEELRPQYSISSRLAGDLLIPCLLGDFDSRHVSMLFPREVVRRAGPWDPRMRVRQDFDFVLRCLEHARATPGDGIATYYRRHDRSATRSARAVEDAQRSTRLLLAGFFARHPELRGSATAREAWRRMHRAEAVTALHQGRPLRTVRATLPLLRLAPGEAVRINLRAGRTAARLSGAATARTTARVLGALRRRAG